MLPISFAYLLLHVPYMENFKTMHASDVAASTKVG